MEKCKAAYGFDKNGLGFFKTRKENSK